MSLRDHSLDAPILESARREFLKNGYEKASLKEICMDAGVTTGAVYKRYKGKAELFEAVVAGVVEELDAVIEQQGNVDRRTLSDADLKREWQMDETAMMKWFRFFEERKEEFYLLLCGSAGTKYEDFRHDLVEKMTDISYVSYQELYARRLTEVELSRNELHTMLSVFWTSIYEPFIHRFTPEELKEHCRIICRFLNWNEVFHFH